MISAVFTIVAVSLGVVSLTTFGYGARDIVVILVPMGIGVAAFFTGLTYLGTWTARRLNRDHENKKDGPENTN